MRNLQIFCWALLALAYFIVRVLFPDLPWWAAAIPFMVLMGAVPVIFQHFRRRQNIQEQTMEQTGVIGLGLGGPRKKKGS